MVSARSCIGYIGCSSIPAGVVLLQMFSGYYKYYLQDPGCKIVWEAPSMVVGCLM